MTSKFYNLLVFQIIERNKKIDAGFLNTDYSKAERQETTKEDKSLNHFLKQDCFLLQQLFSEACQKKKTLHDFVSRNFIPSTHLLSVLAGDSSTGSFNSMQLLHNYLPFSLPVRLTVSNETCNIFQQEPLHLLAGKHWPEALAVSPHIPNNTSTKHLRSKLCR